MDPRETQRAQAEVPHLAALQPATGNVTKAVYDKCVVELDMSSRSLPSFEPQAADARAYVENVWGGWFRAVELLLKPDHYHQGVLVTLLLKPTGGKQPRPEYGVYRDPGFEAMRKLEETLRAQKVIPEGVPMLFVDPGRGERPLLAMAWASSAPQCVRALFDVLVAQMLGAAALFQQQRRQEVGGKVVKPAQRMREQAGFAERMPMPVGNTKPVAPLKDYMARLLEMMWRERTWDPNPEDCEEEWRQALVFPLVRSAEEEDMLVEEAGWTQQDKTVESQAVLQKPWLLGMQRFAKSELGQGFGGLSFEATWQLLVKVEEWKLPERKTHAALLGRPWVEATGKEETARGREEPGAGRRWGGGGRGAQGGGDRGRGGGGHGSRGGAAGGAGGGGGGGAQGGAQSTFGARQYLAKQQEPAVAGTPTGTPVAQVIREAAAKAAAAAAGAAASTAARK